MIGRTRELAAAQTLLAKAGPAAGPLLLRVSGAPGVGKSLFAERVANDAQSTGFFVIECVCHEIQRNSPLVVANRIAANMLKRLGTDAHRYTSGLEEGLAALDPGFANLLGLSPSETRLNRDRYQEVFLRFLDGIVVDYSLLLVVDDAQWIDDDSASILRGVVERFSMGTLAILTVERTDLHNPTLPSSPVAIELQPLSVEESRKLVAFRLPDIPELAMDTVARQGHGNPLEILTICEDVLRNGSSPNWTEQSTRDLVIAHVAQMRPDEREFIQLCSLIGEPIEFRILFKLYPDAQRIAELLEGSVRSYLAPDGPSLRFRHALVADAVAASIEFELPLRSRLIAALESIEQPDFDDLERIITHALACGNRELAFSTYLRLIDVSKQRKSWGAMVSACERVLKLQDPPTSHFVNFFNDYCLALLAMDREPEALTILRDALRVAEERSIEEGIGQLVWRQLTVLMALERMDEAISLYRRYSLRLHGDNERAPIVSAALYIAAQMYDTELFENLSGEFKALDRINDQAMANRLSAEAVFASTLGDFSRAQAAIAGALAKAGGRLSELVEFNRLLVEFRQFGGTAVHQRLPELNTRTRFESQDLFYSRLFFAWNAISEGDWSTALEIFELAYRGDLPQARAASLLAIPAMIGALTKTTTSWDLHIQAMAEVTFKEGYRLSAMQLVPWSVLRFPSASLNDFTVMLCSTAGSQPPRPLDIGFVPLGMALALQAIAPRSILGAFADGGPVKDRSPWTSAQWLLARGIASQALKRVEAKGMLCRSADEFAGLGAHFFAAYAAESAGEASREQTALLTTLGVLKRTPNGEPRPKKSTSLDALTRRELEVAGLVADGLTNRQVAAALFLSERTVEVHLSNVFGKLQISSRSQLIRMMFEIRQAP